MTTRRGEHLPWRELSDHSVGNLIIAALADMAGGFCEGVEQAGRFLRIKGRVYPAATQSLTLVVSYADGSVVRGESLVREVGKTVSRVDIEPSDAVAPAGVMCAIEGADLVVLSPGSLFTSLIPALSGGGVREALGEFGGPVVYAANIMTQPGETEGFALSDHLRAISEHAGAIITDVVAHSGGLAEEVLMRYREEGASAVQMDREEVGRLGVRLHEAPLLSGSAQEGVRHDPERLAEEVCEAALVRL